MKKITKRLILAAVLTAVIAAFSACGNQEGEESNNQEDTEAEKAFAEEMVMPEDLGTTTDLNKFATIDIYGNPVGHEIFGDYEFTVVDVWGTYCDPCIRAMPDMKKVYDEYKDKGVNVVGIVVDVQNADRTPQREQIMNARTIVETKEADFTHMLVPTNLLYSFMSDVQVIPTQFVVDKEGNIVSDYFKGGKDYDQWAEFLDEKLQAK